MLLLPAAFVFNVSGQDSGDPVIMVGTFQSETGCLGDWQLDCELTAAAEMDGLYTLEVVLEAGEYEFRASIDGTLDGLVGDDTTLVIEETQALVTFVYDPEAGTVSADAAPAPAALTGGPEVLVLDNPGSVTIAGTIQTQLGCDEDWSPPCSETWLSYDTVSDIWFGEFAIAAGEYEYKAALDGGWGWNYGLGALRDGPNIPLVLEEDTTVRFTFDVKTGWITDNVNTILATVPGDFQDEIGCEGDWQPNCYLTWLQDVDGDGVYVYRTVGIPEGSYEAKVALNGSWDLNYGADGAQDGPNIPFSVEDDATLVTFSFDSADNVMVITTEPIPADYVIVEANPAETVGSGAVLNPDSVTVAGTIQSQLGCDGDWQPPCEATMLTLGEDNVWRGVYKLSAGDYEYKAALNGSWDENYGLNAAPGGANIPLTVPEDGTVRFYYDHRSNWITDSVNSRIVSVMGSFQDEAGCAADFEPTCMVAWMQDPSDQGTYTASIEALPAGAYEALVVVEEDAEQTIGTDGAVGGDPISFEVPRDDDAVTFVFDGETNVMTVFVGGGLRGDLTRARAHWVSADTLLWSADDAADGAVYALHYAADAGLAITPNGVEGGETIALTADAAGPSEDVLAKFPHLAGLTALKIDEADLDKVPDALRAQHVIAAVDADGLPLDATGLQIPGVLDDLYTTDAPLGITWDRSIPSVHLWAPTAQSVSIYVYDDSALDTGFEVMPMVRDDVTGVWSVTGTPNWKNKYYQFEVSVYVRQTGSIETTMVTDPYSVSLAMNSARSQFVNLNDTEQKPTGWDDLVKPSLDAPEDITVYELHVRDFSIYDETVPEAHQGKYLAFIEAESDGMQHLSALAVAGLTHLHLLPTMDIATIEENPDLRTPVDPAVLAEFAPDSEQQQALISQVRDADGFNWGYDPFHFNVPEGSYATNADGQARIREYRQMVQALNQSGLRVVIDVVYNHTNAAGLSDKSVFDKIVPGYYHRLDSNGNVTTSTCCQNTATEHDMMERFMVDSVVFWATQYKVDAFRFDLMGHHMVDDMVKVREALDALTLEEHGVDGSKIHIYGEGWNFGEVADNARGVNATQLNLPGTGIGTFSDRLRDAVRGGNPFEGLQDQGFINGLYTNPNGITSGSEEDQLARLLLFQDQIRVGLAGNLAAYEFVGRDGETITGADVPYGSAPAGYTQDPQEVVTYISKHDNETLFDIIQLKAPLDTSMADRVRMQNLGLSIVMTGQGMPFFHAGSDMLRSKSLDRDSYNSGDWFNALDFTYETTNWGRGLPSANVGSNRENWDVMRDLLGNTDLAPSNADVLKNVNHFREMLQIRYSSKLFRLETAEQVQAVVAFHNTGVDQVPGLIVMSLTDLGDLDADYARIVVIYNATMESISFTVEELVDAGLSLHPVQAASFDAVVQTSAFDAATGTFEVPALTAAVFVE